jgi:hypothetical protein
VNRLLLSRWTPLILAAAFGLAYALHPPPAPDLAAQTAWGAVFNRAGFVPWFGGWYGGTPTAGYSLISPMLLGVLGPGGAGAIALLLTTALGMVLLRNTKRPVLAAIAVCIAAMLNLLSGRVTFALGLCAAIAALIAVQRGWRAAAFVAGAAAVATSPVAGVLLLLPLAAIAVHDRGRRVVVAFTGAGVIVVLVALQLLAATGIGREPFPGLTFGWSVALSLVVALCSTQPVVRLTAGFAVLAEVVTFVVPNAVGSNIDRLVLIAALPAVIATCTLPRRLFLAATAAVLAVPVVVASVDVAAAASPSAQPAFTAGLVAKLAAEPLARTQRIEVLDTSTHWAAARLLSTVTLARGWERQLDEARNPLFYADGPLTPAAYRSWLDLHAVAYVALPRREEVDFGSTAEAAVVRAGTPYLREIWHDASWRLFEVKDPAPVVVGGGALLRWTDTGAVLRADRAGLLTLRLAYSPYLHVDGGTVLGGTDSRTRLRVDAPGRYVLRASW